MEKQWVGATRNCLILLSHLLTRKERQLVINQKGTTHRWKAWCMLCNVMATIPSPGLDYFHCIPGHSWAASLTALPSTSFVKGKLGNGPTDGFVFLALQDAQKQKKLCISSPCPLPNAVIGFRVSLISLCPTKRITHNWNKESRKKRVLLLERVLLGDQALCIHILVPLPTTY